MKNEYLKPAMQVRLISVATILAGSGDEVKSIDTKGTGISFGGVGNDEPARSREADGWESYE